MPKSPAWCSWLKGTGWIRAIPASVVYGERARTIMTQPKAVTMKIAPKMLTFESVLVLRWKIWGTGATSITENEKPGYADFLIGRMVIVFRIARTTLARVAKRPDNRIEQDTPGREVCF